MALAQITDLAARAASRVLSQYRSKTRFMALLNGINGLSQQVEDALWAIVGQLQTATAQGVWLEYLGNLVGEARAGADDVSYRLFIDGRILANRSQGTVEDLIGVIKKVTAVSAFSVIRYAPASLEITVANFAMVEPIRTRLMQLLRATRAAGVRLMVIYWPDATSTDLFTFSSDDTLQSSSAQGFGSDANPAIGGKFVDADAP